jgi:hypothetical protein
VRYAGRIVKGPTIKGVAFRTVLKLVGAKLGAAVVDQAITAMPEDLAQALRYGEIIPAGRYPVVSYRTMWSALLAAGHQGDEFVRQIGRDAIDNDFNVFYRPLLRILRPATLVSVGMKHFNQIYDTGHVEVIDPTPVSLRLRFTGCVDFDHTIWVELLGSCERLAELAGGKGAQSALVEGGRDGDVGCVATFHWR